MNKLFTVDFEPMWPVPYALVIVAKDLEQAREIAKATIKHEQSEEIDISEYDMNNIGVVLYESGDY